MSESRAEADGIRGFEMHKLRTRMESAFTLCLTVRIAMDEYTLPALFAGTVTQYYTGKDCTISWGFGYDGCDGLITNHNDSFFIGDFGEKYESPAGSPGTCNRAAFSGCAGRNFRPAPTSHPQQTRGRKLTARCYQTGSVFKLGHHP